MNRAVNHNNQKKIAVINDFCGFGRCSIAAALPIISAMKIQCCPLPTSIFSNHTGFDSFYSVDFTPHMKRYIDEWKKLGLRFNGILTGFLASTEQIEIVEDFLKYFKTEDTVIVVDPVMGDYGKLYPTYMPSLAEKMASLARYADILTPNLTEACILTGRGYEEEMGDGEIFEMCREICEMGPEKIVISGVERQGNLDNFIYEKGGAMATVREHKVGACRSGTGDVFSAIIAATTVLGRDFESAVRRASRFIARALRRTSEMQIPATDGICFEEFLGEINGVADGGERQ